METDSDLLRKTALGDLDALGMLYDRYGTGIYRTARRLLLGPEEAEDVVQEAFRKILSGAALFRGGSAHAWIGRIALNLANDRLRARMREKTERLTENIANGKAGLAEDSEKRKTGIEEALASLSINERAAVVLKYFEGCRHAQIAAMTGVSERTVKYRIARAIERLRRILDAN